jgi:hypothetical protein
VSPRIVCAAIQHKNGRIIAGARHFDLVMHKVIEQLPDALEWRTATQGFIDNYGRFFNRQQAWVIATAKGQIRNTIPGVDGTLYSEHLY